MINYNVKYRSLWCLKKFMNLSRNSNGDNWIGAVNTMHIQTFNQKEKKTLGEVVAYTVNSLCEHAMTLNTHLRMGFSVPVRLEENYSADTTNIVFLSPLQGEFSSNVIKILKDCHDKRERYILEIMGKLVEMGYPINPYELKSQSRKKIYEYDLLDIRDQLMFNHPDSFNSVEASELVNKAAINTKYATDFVFDFIDTINFDDYCYLENPHDLPGCVNIDEYPFRGIMFNENTSPVLKNRAFGMGMELLEAPITPVNATYPIKYDYYRT